MCFFFSLLNEWTREARATLPFTAKKNMTPLKRLITQPQRRCLGFSAQVEKTRAPYRARNFLTLLGLGGFVVAVYAYSIRAVKQERLDEDEV